MILASGGFPAYAVRRTEPSSSMQDVATLLGLLHGNRPNQDVSRQV